MTRLSLPSLGLLGAFVLASCSQDQALRRREVDEISAHHDQDLGEFHEAQAEFARANPVPRQLDFGQDGTILIHACALDAPLEHAQLWLRYTWVNTTDHAIDEAVITIRMNDPAGAEVKSVDMPLSLPLKFRFSPDSSYTTSIGIPTDGLHLQRGWSFDIQPHAARAGLGASRYP